jgi:hypothetical protein
MDNKMAGIVIGVLILGVVIFSGINNPEMSMGNQFGSGEEIEVTDSTCMIECSYPAPLGSWDNADCEGDTGCYCNCNPSASCSCGEEKKSKYNLFRSR